VSAGVVTVAFPEVVASRPRGAGIRWVVCLPLMLVAFACDSATAPSTPATIYVTNSTCSSGECSSFEVLAFPSNQPLTPGPMWSLKLGTISSGGACLSLPVADTLRATDAGTGQTTLYVWTSDKPVALGAVEVGQSAVGATPSTREFVPSAAQGWRISLPRDASPSRIADACRPQSLD